MCGVTILAPSSPTVAPTTPIRRSRRVLMKMESDEKENIPPGKRCALASTHSGHQCDCKGDSMLSDPPAKRPRVEGHTISALPTALITCNKELSADIEERAQYPLVSRERECQVLDQFLRQCLGGKLQHERGGSLYVSGGPGTGKTCSVRAAADAWRRSRPETEVVHVNCMDLSQRSVVGLLRHLANGNFSPVSTSSAKCSQSGPALLAAAAMQLSRLSPSVILIVDEVDQLVGKSQAQGTGACALDALFALPRQPGAPALAIVAIANAVDLLERGAPLGHQLCRALLFQPYDADQLRKIVRSRFEAAGATGVAAESALGKNTVELRLRQVAKRSGDCRPIVQLCEQAVFEAARVQEVGADATEGTIGMPARPLVRPDTAHNDPLRAIQQLPMEQQFLLCALASGTGEAVGLAEVCSRYKELCRRLHQSQNLASRDQVGDALSSLEQRGLLALRSCRKKGAGRAGLLTAELAVSRAAVRDSITALQNPLLNRCLE